MVSLLLSSVLAVTFQPLKPWETVWGELPLYFLGVLGAFLVFMVVKIYMARPQFFYDEKGIYRKSRLVSDWKGLAAIRMSAKPGHLNQLGPPIPNFRPYSVAENDEFLPQESVDTSKYFFTFVNRDGKEVARIPTNPSSFSMGGVSQDLIDTAERAGSKLSIS